MANTFTLTGTLQSAKDASPIVGAYIKVRVVNAGTEVEDNVLYPRQTFSLGPTDANGDLPSSSIWVNGDSGVQSYYKFMLPEGENVDVVIPSSVEGTTVRLEDVLELYRVNTSTQQSTVLDTAIDRANHTGGPDDLNGNEIILDVDGDTSITADTDDRIDFKIGGVDELTLTAAKADNLDDIAAITPTDGLFLVGDGTNWVGESGSTLRASIENTLQNTIFVAKNGTDTRTGLDPHDIGNPFLTVNAAEDAASSGDTILVFPGDYSGEAALSGKDGVYYQGLDGAILPAFSVTTAITVKGSGLCQDLICSNANAVIDMPDMHTIDFIFCDSGTQTAGNAGTYIACVSGTQTAGNAGAYIFCDGGTQTAGNAGTYVLCGSGTQTAGNAGTYVLCDGGTQTAGNAGTYVLCGSGTQTAGNAGTYIACEGGTQTAGNAGTYIQCSGGTQTIIGADQSHDGTANPPIALSGSSSLTIRNSRSESTESGGTVVEIANSWSGSLLLDNCNLVATTVATNEATTGITYGTSVTGTVQLKDCTIITAQNGTGTAKSIDAPSAQTVYVQGSLNQTHAIDADITLAGGITNTRTEYTA